MNKSILTIATGKKYYLDLALNLARSFLWWHRDSDIVFQLATDQQEHIPEHMKANIRIISVKPGEFGTGFSPKLFLDRLANDGQTLFIDSDCLVFGDLQGVFKAFKGHPVSVIGKYVSKGEWFGDIASVCRQFNIPHMPQFNGGIYYLEKGEIASQVYQTARDLEKQYDQIGFQRLRNSPNDEVIMSLAMQLHGQSPIEDNGTIMSDLQSCRGKYRIDVLSGKRYLTNPQPPDPLHQEWYPFTKVTPLVVHFLGYYTEYYPYLKNAYSTEKALDGNWNLKARLYAALMIEYPERIKNAFKKVFRPTYHFFFGHRPLTEDLR